MLLSTNRHVGLDLQAELDDARAEIRDLRAENAALKRNLEVTRDIFLCVQRTLDSEQDSLRDQREHYEIEIKYYEKEIAYVKQVGRVYMGEVYNSLGAEHFKVMDPTGHDARVMGYTPERPPPPPPLPPPGAECMPQANPFMITAVGRLHNFDKDQELYADELAVLRQKLRAFKEALRRHLDNEHDTAWNRYMLFKLHEYDVNLHVMNKFKKRIDVVTFVHEMDFENEEKYGKEVAQRAREFLRYWQNHALPGKQV